MAQHSEALRTLIQQKLKARRKSTLIASIVLASLCIFFLVMGIMFPGDDSASEKIWRNLFMVLATAGLAATTYFFQKSYKKFDPENSVMLDIIENNNANEDVVWIYPYKMVYNGVPSYAIVFKMADKDEYSIDCKEHEQQPMLTMLQVSLTNVTFGYSDKYKRQYKKDPKRLIKSI